VDRTKQKTFWVKNTDRDSLLKTKLVTKHIIMIATRMRAHACVRLRDALHRA
jgi:hypothetical protein